MPGEIYPTKIAPEPYSSPLVRDKSISTSEVARNKNGLDTFTGVTGDEQAPQSEAKKEKRYNPIALFAATIVDTIDAARDPRAYFLVLKTYSVGLTKKEMREVGQKYGLNTRRERDTFIKAVSKE